MHHAVEVKLSPELQETVDQTKDAVKDNTKMLFLASLGGMVVGAVSMRLFSRPALPPIVVVVTGTDATVIE